MRLPNHRAEAHIIETYVAPDQTTRVRRGSVCDDSRDRPDTYVYLDGLHVCGAVYASRNGDGTGVILCTTPASPPVYEVLTGRVEILLDVCGPGARFIDRG